MKAGDQILASIVGNEVVVRNPAHPSTVWRGRAVAATWEPSVMVETEEGKRLMLPLSWAVPVHRTTDQQPRAREGDVR